MVFLHTEQTKPIYCKCCKKEIIKEKDLITLCSDCFTCYLACLDVKKLIKYPKKYPIAKRGDFKKKP